MSPFTNRSDDADDAVGPQGQSLHLDLDGRVCRDCRREVAAWVRTCPHCGAGTVTPDQLPDPTDRLLERFRDDGDERS